MKSEGTKLYNLGFSTIMLYLFPQLWYISLPFNFVIDSIVLLLGLKIYGKENIFYNYRKVILKTWLFGYFADIIVSEVQLGFEEIAVMVF